MSSASTHEPYAVSPVDGLSPGITLALGAVTGLALGYLFFTDHGRQFRQRVEPMLDTWLQELSRLRETADKAHLAYTQGRDSLAAMTGVSHARRET